MVEHRPKKLLAQVRDAIRLKHCSYRTKQAYVSWLKRYIHEWGSLARGPIPGRG